MDDKWAFNEYDMFFTNKRIVMAVIHGQRDWRAAPRDDLEAVITATKKILSYDEVKKARREQFRGKTPDEILGLHPDSFEIPYENIKSTKVKRSILFGTVLEIKVLMEGREKKLRFRIPKDRSSDVERVIDRYL